MGLNSIFALFGFPEGDKGPEETEENESRNRVLIKKSPHFKLGMFYKLIMNGTAFKKQVLNFFSRSDSALDMDGN
jgi:hypothetical protein